MFKKFIFITILGATVLADTTISYNKPSSMEISKEELQSYRDLFLNTQTITDKKLEQELSQNRVFAKEFLKQSNLTHKQKTALNIAIEDILAKAYMEEYKQKHQPSQADIKSFYLDHEQSFKPLEKISISSIVTDSLAKADKIYLQLQKEPAQFDAIAQKESLEPNTVSFKNIEITMFSPSIRDWIREHNQTDISEPIQVGRFYYIDRIDNKTQESVSYENLEEKIKDLLSTLYIHNELNNHYDALKKSLKHD